MLAKYLRVGVLGGGIEILVAAFLVLIVGFSDLRLFSVGELRLPDGIDWSCKNRGFCRLVFRLHIFVH